MTPDDAGPGDLVAVYGTLRAGDRNHHLLAACARIADGSVAGALVHVGLRRRLPYTYPGWLPDGDGRVRVELYRVDEAATWAALDALEDHRPDGSGEYVRVRAVVTGDDGATHDAWCYRYAAPVEPDDRLIPGGDWLA